MPGLLLNWRRADVLQIIQEYLSGPPPPVFLAASVGTLALVSDIDIPSLPAYGDRSLDN